MIGDLDARREAASCAKECREAGVYREYLRLVRKGNAPRFAAMLARRRAPATMGTDRSFAEGRYNEYESNVQKSILAEAQAHGVNTHGKVYVGGLGRPGKAWKEQFPWVSLHEARGEILAKSKAIGRSVYEGDRCVYEAPPKEPEPDCPLNPRLVKEGIARELKKDPGLAQRVSKQELEEIVIDQYAYKGWKREKRKKKKK